MELKIWAKTFFSIYRCLDKLASSIDKYVEMKALSSYYKSLSKTTFCCTEKVTADLSELMDKKVVLINIKVITEKVLKALPTKMARFIIMRYIENKTYEACSKNFNISIRTLMRWNTEALNKSAKLLEAFGYNEKELQKIIQDEDWIYHVLNYFNLHETLTDKSKFNLFNVVRLACKEYKTYVC